MALKNVAVLFKIDSKRGASPPMSVSLFINSMDSDDILSVVSTLGDTLNPLLAQTTNL